MKNIALFIVALICLGGCTLAPKYNRPQTDIPQTWPEGEAYQNVNDNKGVPLASELGWRDFFADQRLQQVIAIALENNRDLRIAALTVEKARAMYGIQRAELWPAVDATGKYAKERTPADLSSSGTITEAEKYSVNLGVLAWEIDFFGRLRSLKDAALAEYLASEQGQRSAQILLIAGVAKAYLALAADRENLNLAESTLKAQLESYNMIQRRYEVGMASALELRQAQTRVEAARVDLALFTRITAQDKNALNLLTGSQLPENLLPANLQSVTPPREISAGLSSEVLLQRPDIVQAENILKAANANIGAARAAFFPRISLTTTVGTASAELSGLFESGQGTWSFAPQITMPIFDPRIWSALRATKVENKLVLTKYEKAIQTAFREVADALAVHGTMGKQLAAQQALVDATAETYRLADIRYNKGVDSYLTVLDAQRSLYGAQQGLVSQHLTKLANLVQMYAVLGGGWHENTRQPFSPDAPAEAPSKDN
ncbi:MAG: efflux transporter outer membrane subunit [Deltaproteobacteria bacterium]|nr:efflux transporter outer membrane subunit [Deltaproteobacteria bacterium]